MIRFFKKVLKGCQYTPRVIVTDKLRSYYAPCKFLLPKAKHRSHKRLNNRVENSHQPTRRRENQMIRFKSPASVNQFLATHGQVRNLFMVGRYTETASTRRVNLSESLHLWDDIAHNCQQIAA